MTDRDDVVTVTADAPKADPSRNATTHGLTAKRPLCEQEADRLRILVDSWTSTHLPETEGEEALVQTAAVEYVRYLRCVQADEAQLGPNARKALEEWEEKRRHAIRRKAQDLRDEPERIAAALHESAFGIDWMLGHWRALLRHVDIGRGWLGEDLAMAMRLLGRPPQRPGEADVDGRRLWETAWRACPSAFDARAQRGLVDAEAASQLRELVVDRIERLEALRPTAWEEVEGPQAEAVEAAAMLDTSKDGQLRQRYRREALRDMHRGIGMLIRLKVERSKIDDRFARQERLGAKSRSSPADDRPAWVAPSASRLASDPADGSDRPAPVGATADGSDAQRNGPPEPRPAPNENHRNPNKDNEMHANPGERSPAHPRRTEAHPGMPGGPSGRPNPGRPDARTSHPARPTRPEVPDRAS